MTRILAILALGTLTATGALAQGEKMGQGGQQAMKGQKVSQEQCESLWNRANPAGENSISFSKAGDYITDVKAINPDNDQTIERGEFMNACNRGLIKSTATTGAGAGEGAMGSGSGYERQQKQ